MDEIGLAIMSAVIGAFSALLTALVAALVKGRADIDAGLLSKRETAYEALLALTSPVSAWPPNDDLTYGELAEVGEHLRAWYFASGLIMSEETRSAYGELQKGIERRRLAADEDTGRKLSETRALQGISALEPLPAGTPRHVRGDPAVTRDDYDVVQQLFSGLRTSMTRDLLSRSRPIVFGGRF